ncbi:MAG: hypothetical protein HRU72_03960 [Planctomycetia bacterium]|nr:MAG: hypothetical protein HRU72_03960 [Planctomycetia bacterium]
MIKHGQTEFVHATQRRRFVPASRAWEWSGMSWYDGERDAALAVDEKHL